MFAKNNYGPPITKDIHAFLEKTLIESYLKGKGFTLEDLKHQPMHPANLRRWK